MATIRGFQAQRPAKEKAAEVSAVPYDVVNTTEARELAEGNPLSFLHVSRPEIDLPDGTDVYSDAVYHKAKENFEKLKAAAPLSVEETPSLYVYRLRLGEHQQTGIAGCCSIDEYDSDIVRKHERTRKDKEDDRTRHMVALRAQTGPVFPYRGRRQIDEIVAASKLKSAVCLSSPRRTEVAHAIWRVGEARRSVYRRVRGPVGLHRRRTSPGCERCTRAGSVQSWQPGTHRHGGVQLLFDGALASRPLRILPYTTRVVKDLDGKTPSSFSRLFPNNLTFSDARRLRHCRKKRSVCTSTGCGTALSSRPARRPRSIRSRPWT